MVANILEIEINPRHPGSNYQKFQEDISEMKGRFNKHKFPRDEGLIEIKKVPT